MFHLHKQSGNRLALCFALEAHFAIGRGIIYFRIRHQLATKRNFDFFLETIAAALGFNFAFNIIQIQRIFGVNNAEKIRSHIAIHADVVGLAGNRYAVMAII